MDFSCSDGVGVHEAFSHEVWHESVRYHFDASFTV